MADVTLPRANSAPIDARSLQFTTEWYNFFRGLLGGEAGDDFEAQIQALAARVTALEEDESSDFIIQGVGSVAVYGTPQSGVVQVTLDNDLTSPGVGFVYSTDALGAKAWSQLAAEYVTYDNATSGLSATEVQGAIDEIAAGGVSGDCCEILVSDTDSAPPVMLTNEAEDDFLYSD